MADEKLAVLGGSPAVSLEKLDRWVGMTDDMIAAVEAATSSENIEAAGFALAKDVESGFCELVGSRFAAAQHNGTSTLWSACYSLGVGPGDEVIHPNFTWICSVAPTYFLGAKPVFADLDPRTFLIDAEDIERRITPRTKAITVVHWGGNLCDMDAVMYVANRHGIPVIEDASHAHGARYDGKGIGSIGAVAGFSFQGVPGGGKPVAGGEAGMVTTSDRHLYERILLFGHTGRPDLAEQLTEPDHARLAPYGLGWSFRAHPLGLAIARVQLARVREQNALRWRTIQALMAGLDETPGVDPIFIYPKAEPAGWYGGIQVRYRPEDLAGLPIDRYCEALQAEGVRVRGGGQAYHRLPLFARGFDLYTHGRGPLWEGYTGISAQDYPRSRECLPRMLTLPVITDPVEGAIEQILNAFRKVAANAKQLF